MFEASIFMWQIPFPEHTMLSAVKTLMVQNFKLSLLLTITGPSPFDKLSPDFLRDAETARDRLVAKAAQLIQNITTKITENLMSIRCKINGGKFYSRIQSGFFQHRSMAAALQIQYGPGSTTSVLSSLGIQSSICDEFINRRKGKYDKDNA